MPSHQTHHYVPAFLLRQWQSQPDSRLSQFRWAYRALRVNRHSASRVASVRHPYAAQRSAQHPDVALERDYLGPVVDEPAATVHASLLSKVPIQLEYEQRVIWARFLVAQMIRVPSMIQHMRVHGREILMRGLDERPEEYDAVRGDAPEESLAEWLSNHAVDAPDDVAIGALPDLIESPLLNGVVLSSDWAIIDLKWGRFDLLIGDRPLIKIGSLSGRFLFALPISPRRLFIAFNDSRTYRNVLKRDKATLVKDTNLETVRSASEFVYGTSELHTPLVRRYLAKPLPD